MSAQPLPERLEALLLLADTLNVAIDAEPYEVARRCGRNMFERGMYKISWQFYATAAELATNGHSRTLSLALAELAAGRMRQEERAAAHNGPRKDTDL